MYSSFIQITGFVNVWRRYRLTDDDLRALEGQLSRNPDSGAVIAGTGGVRKTRFAPPSRHVGKSGAFRVVYLHLPVRNEIYFISLFAKSERQNVTDAEKARYKAIVDLLKSRGHWCSKGATGREN